MADPVAVARAYYDSLDGDDYDELGELLAPGFVHDRPDQSIEGKDEFVAFMREDRPLKDTTHPIDSIYRPEAESEDELAVRGRLLDSDGERITSFVDVFSFDGEHIAFIQTYTNR